MAESLSIQRNQRISDLIIVHSSVEHPIVSPKRSCFQEIPPLPLQAMYSFILAINCLIELHWIKMWMSSSSNPHLTHFPLPTPNWKAFFWVQIALYIISHIRQAFFGSKCLLQRAERWKFHYLLSHRILHLLLRMTWRLWVWITGGIGHSSLWFDHWKALGSKGGSLICRCHQSPGSHCINLLPMTSNYQSDRLKEAIRLALDSQVFALSSQRFFHNLMPNLCIFSASSKS